MKKNVHYSYSLAFVFISISLSKTTPSRIVFIDYNKSMILFGPWVVFMGCFRSGIIKIKKKFATTTKNYYVVIIVHCNYKVTLPSRE